MSSAILALVMAAAVVLAAGVASLVVMVQTYLKYRGASVVNCPETKKPAGVRVDAMRAAVESLPGRSGKIELEECSRWLERGPCGERCVSQIQHDADLCHVSAIAEQWYFGRECALCGKPIGKLRWHDHAPALLDRERHTVQWDEVRPEKLRAALETQQPICWSCHIAEKFRQQFPERVVDRPWKRGAMGEYIGEEDAEKKETPVAIH